MATLISFHQGPLSGTLRTIQDDVAPEVITIDYLPPGDFLNAPIVKVEYVPIFDNSLYGPSGMLGDVPPSPRPYVMVCSTCRKHVLTPGEPCCGCGDDTWSKYNPPEAHNG
jgi:hypothetical protein